MVTVSATSTLHPTEPSVPAIDSLLAVTALHHDLRMVTRNERDFQFPCLEVINPWQFS